MIVAGRVQIFEVRYPDVRRGDGGFSTALFRSRMGANRMAERFGARATVTPRWVTLDELNQLVRDKYLPAGAADSPRLDKEES